MAVADLIAQTLAQHIANPRVISFAGTKLNEVQGRFIAANRVYNFVLDKKGVSYSPAGRNDSLVFSALFLERLDAARKPKVGSDKCNAGKSYQCGKTCISNRWNCRKGVKDVNDARRIASILASTNEGLKARASGDVSEKAQARGRALFEARGNRVENGETISSGTSTGKVVKIKDKVYKNATFANGKQTLEGEIFKELKDIDGVAKGRLVKRNEIAQIELPFYKNIISVDDIPPTDRKKISNIVSANTGRINQAISALTDAGYAYNDPLQFGYANNKMDLLDFSNASKPTDKYRDIIEENYSALASFYKAFGLETQGKTVLDGVRMLNNLKNYEDDDEVNPFLPEAEQQKLKQVKTSGIKARNVYYSRNARSVQIPNIGQTDVNSDNEIKYVFSEKPLTKKNLVDWELEPIYERKK